MRLRSSAYALQTINVLGRSGVTVVRDLGKCPRALAQGLGGLRHASSRVRSRERESWRISRECLLSSGDASTAGRAEDRRLGELLAAARTAMFGRRAHARRSLPAIPK